MAEAPRPEELLARVLPAVGAQHNEAWLVGGWVRDRLLGRETHDVDFVVPGGAIATARQVADLVGGAFVLLDEARDTARVLVGAAGQSVFLDFAGLREPGIEADLLARDFTVNAMAVTAAECLEPAPKVIDPAGGRRDLAAHLLRVVSERSFRDDPLRMLRAVRLGAALGFELERETALLARRDAALLDAVSRERVRDELAQTLALPGAERSLRQLDELGLLGQVLGELEALRTLEAGGLDDTLRTVGMAQAMLGWLGGAAWGGPQPAGEGLAAHLGPYRARLDGYLGEMLPGGRRKGTMLLVAALLHEVGMGASAQGRAAPGGRFLGHEALGASMAATAARRLCFSSAEVLRVRQAVRSCLRPAEMAREMLGAPARREIYRFFRDAEPAGVEAILLSLAADLAAYDAKLDRERWQRHLAASAALLEAYFEQRQEVLEPPTLVNGRELIEALGLSEGPQVGVLLDGIREAQAAGEVRSREEALALARRLLAREGLL